MFNLIKTGLSFHESCKCDCLLNETVCKDEQR